MARFLSRARTLFVHCTSRSSSFNYPPLMPLSVYNCQIRHTSAKGQLTEIEVDSSQSPVSSASSTDSDLDFSLAVQRMENLIQFVLVQKSTPNWLPFLPGSSFWVPPYAPITASDLIIELVDRLTEEETLAVSTFRGWPSTAYFIPDSTSTQLVNTEVEVKVLDDENTDVEMQLNASQAKDNEK